MRARLADLAAAALASGYAGLALAGCTDPAPLQLAEATQHAFTLSTTEVDFGDVVINSAGYDFVEVQPIFYEDTPITAITYDCPAFVLTHTELPFSVGYDCEEQFVAGAGAKAAPPAILCEPPEVEVERKLPISIAFMPTSLGPHFCNVTIDSQFDGSRTLSLSGNSVPTPHDISVLSPLTLPFGQVPIGTTSSTGEVTVRSVGSQALTFSAIELAGAGFALASGNSTPHTLAPGTNEAFGVTCTPSAVGPITGTLTLTHDSDDVGERPTVFELTCEGIDSNLTVNPSPVTLPITRVGEPTSITLTLGAAIADTTVTFQAASVAGAGLSITSQPAAGTVLSGANPGQLELAFAPTADGDVNGVLTIEHDGETRQVSVLAPARISTLALSPGGDLAFGPVCPGDAETETLIINNPGSAAYELADVTLTGPGFELALVTPEALPFVVDAAGGNAATLTITATPPEGPQAGALTITSDVPGHETTTVAVTATGMPAGVAATPLEVDFGEVTVGASSAVSSVYLSNCVAAGLTIEGATVTGPDADEFVIVQAPISTTIGASQAAEWVIQLQPDSAGDKVATLELAHGEGVEIIALRGASALSADDIRGTYYACSSSRGGAGGAALLLLALGAVLVPRRRRARR